MKGLFKSSFLSLAGAVLSISALAQDIHYSQFFASPLNLNPALTGFIQGNVRGVLNYRNQWKSITPNSYVTLGASADMAFGRGKMGDDWVGGGLIVLSDKAGTGALSKTKIMLSGSYFKGLSEGQYLAA